MTECIYTITMRTPLGPKTGTMTLGNEDGIINGELNILGTRTECRGTVSENGDCAMIGEIKTFMSSFRWQGTGKLTDDEITLVITSGKHRFSIKGIRKEEEKC